MNNFKKEYFWKVLRKKKYIYIYMPQNSLKKNNRKYESSQVLPISFIPLFEAVPLALNFLHIWVASYL